MAKMNKKGQWVHALSRERRSRERKDRIKQTSRFLSQGLTQKEISDRLNVSETTIKKYIQDLREEQELIEKHGKRKYPLTLKNILVLITGWAILIWLVYLFFNL